MPGGCGRGARLGVLASATWALLCGLSRADAGADLTVTSVAVANATGSGGAPTARLVVEADVSGLYAWPPYFDPEPALALALLLGAADVEIALLVAGGASPGWARRLAAPGACVAAARLLQDLGRTHVALACAEDRLPTPPTAGATWLALGEAPVLAAALQNGGAAGARRLVVHLAGGSAPPRALATWEEALLRLARERRLPVLAVPRDASGFVFGIREADSIRRQCPDLWAADRMSGLKFSAWLQGHMRKWRQGRTGEAALPRRPQPHGLYPSALLAAAAAAFPEDRAPGLFQESCLDVSPGRGLGMLRPCSGNEWEVRGGELGDGQVFLALVIDGLCHAQLPVKGPGQAAEGERVDGMEL